MKEGRIVLPLKSNFKGRVKGLIHEVSQSGATVFIEPFDLVTLNNELTMEHNKLNQIVTQIYVKLGNKLRECSYQLEEMVKNVSFIDSWYARAAYSIRHNCIRPMTGEDEIIIKGGRHPLLGEKAVPISISFSSNTNTLIITGPNAGGKTVTLKTCGLFTLLNQLACEIPAEEGTTLSIFNNVLADIGDEQSIEESLSTFSGHIKRIANIIKTANQKSLVLLDELGSGTDPSQGAAIAMGILENLREKGIKTIITSHHTAVKNYGYTHKGVKNASVAFDTKTMKPSYKIIDGVPGESHAIEIAQSNGLQDVIIKKANSFLESGNTKISEMIKELEARHYRIMEKEKTLSENEKTMIEMQRRLELQKLRLKQEKYEIKARDYSYFKKFILDSRKELENLVRELREGEITKEKTAKVKKHITKLNNELNTEREKIELEGDEVAQLSLSNDNNAKPQDFKIGCNVKYKINNKTGILLEKRKKNQWLVAFGNIKLTIKEKELMLIESNENKIQKEINYGGFSTKTVLELDLRGMRVYEAESELSKQIDSALISGVNQFSIIHGLGDGILQRAVADFLTACNAVKSFSFSAPEAGGFGKTIVKLK